MSDDQPAIDQSAQDSPPSSKAIPASDTPPSEPPVVSDLASPQAPPSVSSEATEQPVSSQEPVSAPQEPVSLSTPESFMPSVSTGSAEVVPPEPEPIKEEIPSVQVNTTPQNEIPPEPIQPPTAPAISPLCYPYYATYPITFGWGAQSSDEAIKKKYQEWGLVGHNGIDFGLPEGTEVLACDDGIVSQAGDNGDFGISITIKHSWGTSIYGHLQSIGVLVNDPVTKKLVIGLSGQTGFVTGPHLHFGIQPIVSDGGNGYGGYVDPTPYLSEHVVEPQIEKPAELSEEKPVQAEPPKPEPAPEETPVVPSEPVKEETVVSSDVSSETVSQEEVLTKAEAMFDARVKENAIKGNQVKKEHHEQALQKIYTRVQEKKRITNEEIRDLLHVSQSTASNYATDLVRRGMLKTEGKGKATVYTY